MVTLPISFQFNIPVNKKVTHGIVGEERGGGEREKSREETNWYKAASGLRAEQKIFDKLQEQFSDHPCLLVNGFYEQNMVKVIKEGIDRKGIQLSDQVYIIINIIIQIGELELFF